MAEFIPVEVGCEAQRLVLSRMRVRDIHVTRKVRGPLEGLSVSPDLFKPDHEGDGESGCKPQYTIPLKFGQRYERFLDWVTPTDG